MVPTGPMFSTPTTFCRDQQHRRALRPLHTCRKQKESAMSIRNTLIATAFAFASLTTAYADGLRPIEAKSIDLGDVSGVAYYTVERDGFHVVTTLAQGEAGTPIRVVSVLAPGQRVVLSTASQASRLEISRQGDSVLVQRANGALD